MAELNSITKTAAKLTKHLSQVRGLYRGIFHVSLWLGHFWVSKHSSFVSRQHCLFGCLSTIYLEFLAQLWLSSSGKVDIVRDAHVCHTGYIETQCIIIGCHFVGSQRCQE